MQPNGIQPAATQEVLDATVSVTTRTDDGFTRTCIALAEIGKRSASIDVTDMDGKLLCRLNIFAFDIGGGDVDVILDPATQQGTFLAWLDGKKVVRESPQGVSVFAVDIKPKS